MTYTITERMMRDRLGAAYDPEDYREGEHYVRRKAFKGERRMYRKDIFEVVGDVPVQVEEAAIQAPIQVAGDGSGIQPEGKQEAPEAAVGVDTGVYRCRVTRTYPNTRYVETDRGRVFVGGKGVGLKPSCVLEVSQGILRRVLIK
jgi:hypothetical protein